jgi:c-di-GMP phosphodiesterase
MLLTTKRTARGITKMDSAKSSDWEELAVPIEWEKLPKFLDDEARNPESDLAQDMEINDENVDEFISLISHELRTPLTCIRGAIGLLLSGKIGAIPQQGQRMLEIALNNTDRLVRLTNMIESNPEAQAKILTAEDLERLRLGNDLYAAVASALRNNHGANSSQNDAATLSINHIANLEANQELTLNYQPIVDLDTREITGFEALARWYNPRLGTISPGEFIPIAEETGLINDLGIWVLRTACKQLHQWQQEFPDHSSKQSSLTMSVNVSGIQLADPEFIFQVQAVLAEYPLRPTSLRLEITETVLMENKGVTLDTLNQLKELGIKLYIDDFGTGYSSLSRLYELPLDILKIDQSFIRQQKWDLVYTLMLLAHSQKLGVIVEGVETQTQCDRLQSLGCTDAQGYFFSRPVDTIAATKFLADKKVFTTN